MDAFDAWVAHLFDRPPRDLRRKPWYHRHDAPPTEWTLRHGRRDSATARAERIRRLFDNAGQLLRPYSDEQVGHGLTVIIDPAFGAEILAIRGGQIPSALKQAALRSIVTLYAEVFAPRLRGKDSEQGREPLSFACFMFWDVAPLVPSGDPTVLDVLERTLALESVPCQRSALHGLGHEYPRSPDEVPRIVDRWLARHPYAGEELRAYAESARAGTVQ